MRDGLRTGSDRTRSPSHTRSRSSHARVRGEAGVDMTSSAAVATRHMARILRDRPHRHSVCPSRRERLKQSERVVDLSSGRRLICRHPR